VNLNGSIEKKSIKKLQQFQSGDRVSFDRKGNVEVT
jgi:hypothetical protein